MERPLYATSSKVDKVSNLACALLYVDQTVAAHYLALLTVFGDAIEPRHLAALAKRTLALTKTRPQPRLRLLEQQLRSDRLFEEVRKRHPLLVAHELIPPRMRPLPGVSALPVLETIGDLAAWLRVDFAELLWFADLRDLNDRSGPERTAHYERHVLTKRSGGFRLVEAPRKRLKGLQKQILSEILDHVPLLEAVHGFRRYRSILTFTRPHSAQEFVLRIDLQDFFPSISGARIQAVFRTLGYPEHVADLLGGICSTTTPRNFWKHLDGALNRTERQDAAISYARPHLPQGAPGSGALANLCAFRLDRRLSKLAGATGAIYTRYADDLAFSGNGNFARRIDRLIDHAKAIVVEEGFLPNLRKTRLMRQSVRQHLAGLTLNRHVNMNRVEFDRLKATLTNCVRYGAETQNHHQHPDFRQYLQGRVAFAAMVNPARTVRLRALLSQIRWE